MHCNFILYFIALISITAVQAFPLVGGGALGGLGGLLGGGNGLPLVGGLLGGLLARAKKPENPQFINSDQATTQNACNVGTAQCCQSLHQTQDKKTQGIFGALGLLGVELPLDNLMVGLQCMPIAGAIGLGASNACHSTPVCCTGNKFDGLINIGCSPISAN